MRTPHLPRPLSCAVIATALMVGACSGTGTEDTITLPALSVSYPVSENHSHSRVFAAFADEVTERTDGQVTFEHHYNAALCALPEAVECASNGTVDISFVTHAFTPELSLANLSSTAFVSTDLQAAADAHNQLHRENEAFATEFDDRGVEILFHLANSTPLVALADPIDSLADLAGMSVRAAGSMASAIEGLGSNAVATAPAEIYESVERGVVQGLVLPLESIVDLRLHEVAPHIYDIGEYVGLYAMSGYAINQSVWDGLPDDVRDVMTEVAAEMAPSFVEDFLLPFVAETCETAAADGATVEPIGPATDGQSWATSGRQDQLSTWIASASGVDDPQAAADSYVDLYDSLAGEATTPTHDICGGAE